MLQAPSYWEGFAQVGSANTSNAVTHGSRDNSLPSAAIATHCSPPQHLHRFYLCHETRRNDLRLTDRDERQGMRWSSPPSLQTAVVWFSITESEILKRDIACELCWKLLETVKVMNLLFSEYFACEKIPCGLACCGNEFLIFFFFCCLALCQR